MTSGDTHDKSHELLESEDYFGMKKGQVTLLNQEKVPALMTVMQPSVLAKVKLRHY